MYGPIDIAFESWFDVGWTQVQTTEDLLAQRIKQLQRNTTDLDLAKKRALDSRQKGVACLDTVLTQNPRHDLIKGNKFRDALTVPSLSNEGCPRVPICWLRWMELQLKESRHLCVSEGIDQEESTSLMSQTLT